MASWVISLIEGMLITLTMVVVIATIYFRQLRRMGQRSDAGSDHGVPSVGFLHPNAGGGGGGERVLWIALRTLQRADKRSGIRRHYTLYTRRYAAPGDTGSSVGNDDVLRAGGSRSKRDDHHLLSLVEQQFGIPRTDFDLDRVKFVYLSHTWLLDPKYYPRLTLILQSFVGGFAAFLDVAARGATDVVVDTVGIPCSYAFLSLLCGCTVATYTHYPVISKDMMQVVSSRTANFNNAGAITRSPFLSRCKLQYYRFFAACYRWFGGNFATVVMTNSSWTDDHIRHMWRRHDTSIVFPPCNMLRFAAAPLEASSRQQLIVSVGQFRPEKNHSLQVRAFATALRQKLIPPSTKMHLVGGVRDQSDSNRVKDLRRLIDDLGLSDKVVIETDAPIARVIELLSTAVVGLHTMRDEHFGIVVAEYMAAGAIAVAHNSAGPKRDIVEAGTGFLCESEEEFSVGIGKAFELHADATRWLAFVTKARESAKRFSDAAFARSFATRLAPVLALTLLADEDDDGVKLCC